MLSGDFEKFVTDDIRVRIRKMLSVYKEISEGLLKHLLPYLVTCLAIVKNNTNTDFTKNSLLGLGNLVSNIDQSNYPALKIITNTKTGLSIHDIRNVSAHSSIRTSSSNQIELTFKKGNKIIKKHVKENDILYDIQHLADIVLIVKFSISLFVIAHVPDLDKKLIPKHENLQREDSYFYLFDCFAKFQYGVKSIPNISDSLISINVESLTEKNWKDILVEISIHLPVMHKYLEMANQKNITKIRIIGWDHYGNEVGFVELAVDLINKLARGKEDLVNVFYQIQFFNAKRNRLDISFNNKAIKLIKLEENKVDDLKKSGLM